MKTILFYLKPHFRKMLLGFSVKFVGSIMDLFLPLLLSVIIDDVVPTGNRTYIYLCGGVMVVCAGIAVGGNILANRMAAKVSRCTTETLRDDLFRRISYLSARQLDAFTIPSLESRLTSDTYNVHQMVGMFQRMGVRAPCLLIGGILLAFTMEPILTLVLLSMMPLIAGTVYWITRRGIPLYSHLQTATDDMTWVVRENALGIRIIKALGKEETEKKRFEESNGELNRAEQKAAQNMALTGPLMSLFLNMGLVAVICVGAVRVNNGVSETGKIIAFTSYFTIILNAFMSITRIFIQSSRGIASANRIGEVLEAPMDMTAEPVNKESCQASAAGTPKISFEHVSFSYGGIKNDLEDISFTLDAGQTLGIIGPTGAGKTTLLALLMRQYDADTGTIRLDGQDIRTMKQEDIAKKFGVAFQNDFLFADTVAANIAFGRNIPEDEIQKATVHAQAAAFLEEKPGGLDFGLSMKGSNLSGGQKQRLILSRALAGNPEILVLDDSSSALDYATDAQLRQAIRQHYSGRVTSVIVAQRVSSIMYADRILVLENGKIIGEGRHEDLLLSCPLYKEISDSQIGGALFE